MELCWIVTFAQFKPHYVNTQLEYGHPAVQAVALLPSNPLYKAQSPDWFFTIDINGFWGKQHKLGQMGEQFRQGL